VEHRLVFAVFAKEGRVFAEVHILQVIRDKTPVTSLDPFSEVGHGLIARLLAHSDDVNKRMPK
jgi:hypothetical protein